MRYDVVIVGAGPAGLFAAHKLASYCSVLVIDKGKEIKNRLCPSSLAKAEQCNKCHICAKLCGIGGAGLFSDGKLIFASKVGKTDLTEFVSEHEAQQIIDSIDRILIGYGLTAESYPKDTKKADEIATEATKAGMTFLVVKQKHIGSNKLPDLIDKFYSDLKSRGVKFMPSREVSKLLVKNRRIYGIECGKDKIEADKVLVCPGRAGNEWMRNEAQRLGIPTRHRPIEIGVRIEVPSAIMREVTNIVWDPIFFITTRNYGDTVRTFCTNPNGFVVIEPYATGVGVNGHCRKDIQSENTNFALLENIKLTEPIEDTINYGKWIAGISTNIGGGKPILQRLGDLRAYRRSTKKRIIDGYRYIKPTLDLEKVTPGDIARGALPARTLENIVDALEQLDRVIPGIANDGTLLYAPEIKFFSVRVETDKSLETQIKGLYVAGDGVGVSGNIVGSAATGIIAANAILKAQ